MPKAVFMVSCYSILVEQSTGLTTFYNVIEKLEINKMPEAAEGKVIVIENRPLVVAAVWMREDAEAADQKFECEFRSVDTNGETKVLAPSNVFQFSQPLHKQQLILGGFSPFTGSGVAYFQCAIREVGKADWQVQAYPILVDAKDHPESQKKAQSESKNRDSTN